MQKYTVYCSLTKTPALPFTYQHHLSSVAALSLSVCPVECSRFHTALLFLPLAVILSEGTVISISLLFIVTSAPV